MSNYKSADRLELNENELGPGLVTIEEMRTMKSFVGLNDDHLQEILDTLHTLADIAFNIWQRGEEQRHHIDINGTIQTKVDIV